MKLRYKLIIFLAAALISFVAFNMIASPIANGLHKAGMDSNHRVVAKVVDVRLANC